LLIKDDLAANDDVRGRQIVVEDSSPGYFEQVSICFDQLQIMKSFNTILKVQVNHVFIRQVCKFVEELILSFEGGYKGKTKNETWCLLFVPGPGRAGPGTLFQWFQWIQWIQ
jgi:hypothetical protein